MMSNFHSFIHRRIAADNPYHQNSRETLYQADAPLASNLLKDPAEQSKTKDSKREHVCDEQTPMCKQKAKDKRVRAREAGLVPILRAPEFWVPVYQCKTCPRDTARTF